MDAVESCRYLCDCRVFALNSYENRVLQICIDGQPPMVAKFYRPGRWSDAAIFEEFRANLARRARNQVAPQYIVDWV